MNATKGFVVAAVTLSAACSFAGVVQYTGAGTVPGDLADRDNFEPALQDGDIAWLDLSATSLREFTLGQDVALGGLVISNNAGLAVTFSSSNVLSLGAAGFAVHQTGTINMKAPVALTAAQTWSLGTSALNTYSTLSGTVDLTIMAAGTIAHYAAPKYGGYINYARTQGLRYLANDVPWAKKVTSRSEAGDNATDSDYIAFTNEVRWSDLFTGGTYDTIGWRKIYLCTPKTAKTYAKFVMDESTDYWNNHGPYFYGITSGIFEQLAGKTDISSYHLMVGQSNYALDAYMTQTDGRFPCEYWLKGGTVTASYVGIGGGAQAAVNEPKFVQSGGTATWNMGVHIGTQRGAAQPSYGEYRMEGGLMKAGFGGGSDHKTSGLAICHPFDSATSQPGVYTQTGGAADVYTLKFGPDTGTWNGNPPAVNSAFGLFDLQGGSFTNRSKFSLGKGWNTTSTNSCYRILQRGGTMAFASDIVNDLPVFFAPGAAASVWDTGAKSVTMDAPVVGDGTLRKVGSGKLSLRDANRFTGAIDVAEGMLDVAGEPDLSATLPAPESDYWVWTGDSLSTACTNGETVGSWADDRAGLVATDWKTAETYAAKMGDQETGKGTTAPTYKGKLPTFAAANEAFNGHASVVFSGAMLAVPAKENPLVGETNFTMVVVFRPNDFGNADIWYGHPFFCGSDYYYSPDAPILSLINGERVAFGACTYPNGSTRTVCTVSSRTGKALKDTVNVAVCTVDGLTFGVNVNGYFTNQNFSASYKSRPMFKASGVSLPLCFGGMFPDSLNFRSLYVNFAEIRIYKNRVFSPADQNKIVVELLKKYRGDAAGETEALAEINSGIPGRFAGETAPAEGVATDASWTAETLTSLADGDEVTAWPNEKGDVTATRAQAGVAKGPRLVRNAMNGKSVLRFSAAEETALAVPAGDSMLSGAQSFTAAVVFRTTTDGVGTQSAHDKTSGLLSTYDISSRVKNDFGFGLGEEGTLQTQVGNSAGGNGIWDRRPFRLHDGLPHVAVYTYDFATKRTVRYVDGLANTQDISAVAVRDAHDLFVGAMAAGMGHFTGDIAAFRLYDRALTASEVATLSKRYAYDYGFLLLPRVKFGASDVSANGLHATNVNVAAGATFRLPYSETDPFVLKGISLTGEGAFLGSYCLGEGSTFSSATAANIEDLRLTTGSTLVFRRSDTLPLTAGEGLRLSGTITVDVSDFASEQRQPGQRYLLSVDSAKVAEGTSFVLKGLDPHISNVVYDRDRGLLYVRTQNGLILLVR